MNIAGFPLSEKSGDFGEFCFDCSVRDSSGNFSSVTPWRFHMCLLMKH